MKNKVKKVVSSILLFTILVSAFLCGSINSFASDDIFATQIITSALQNDILESSRGYIFSSPITREQYCELIYNLIHSSIGDFELPDVSVEFDDTTNRKVLDLARLGIVYGKSEKMFSPEDRITREEVAVIVDRCVNSVLPLPRHEMYYIFDDENEVSDWAKNSVQTVFNLGVMKNHLENKFSPKETYTVEESIILVMKIFDLYKLNETSTQNVTITILKDNKDVIITEPDDVSVISDITSSYSYENPICKGVVTHTISYNNEIYSLLESCGEIRKGDKQSKISEADIVNIKKIISKVYASEGEITVSNVSFADNLNSFMPNDQNYMFSPFSIKMALAMAANGADGITKEEILSALAISDLDAYNASAKELIETYSQSDLLKLSVANSIWINQDKTTQKFSNLYQSALKDIFEAESSVVNNSDYSKKINNWVNDKTNGKIPSIVSDDNSDFWAMLINAVYFKGRWQNEFHPSATAADIFYSQNGSKKNVDFMNRRAWYTYANVDGVEIVNLPYLNRQSMFDDNGEFIGNNVLGDLNISMYLMMSESEFNPQAVLENTELSSNYIDLYIPKFKIEYDTEMTKILKKLGINEAFKNTAEFEKMFDKGSMQIDSIKHKTYISIDEEGTEAAAVTSIAMAGSALPPKPIVLKYNKPFVFVIRDNLSGEILFMGKYAFA